MTTISDERLAERGVEVLKRIATAKLSLEDAALISGWVHDARNALRAQGGVRVAAARLLAHWDKNAGPEKRGEFEGVEYWSPAGRMVDTQFVADLRAALAAKGGQ